MISVLSPAKLNLFLSVLAKRSDGYHDIATVFARLNFGDRMRFMSRGDSYIHITGCGDIPRDNNLIYRAASALQQAGDVRHGAHISVQKRIPQGAGLGGGSSNAATTLLTLNRLWQLHLAKEQLAEIASSLGADVGFFVQQVPYALGLGRGDQLQPLQGIGLWHLLLLVQTHASSAALYADPRLVRRVHVPEIITSMAHRGALSVAVCNRLDNDFAPALEDNGAIQHALALCNALPCAVWRHMVLTPRLTGSGSSIFLSFKHPFWAQQAYNYLRAMQPNGTIHPVLVRTHPAFTQYSVSPSSDIYSGV